MNRYRTLDLCSHSRSCKRCKSSKYRSSQGNGSQMNISMPRQSIRAGGLLGNLARSHKSVDLFSQAPAKALAWQLLGAERLELTWLHALYGRSRTENGHIHGERARNIITRVTAIFRKSPLAIVRRASSSKVPGPGRTADIPLCLAAVSHAPDQRMPSLHYWN